jgi:hypothetical protein
MIHYDYCEVVQVFQDVMFIKSNFLFVLKNSNSMLSYGYMFVHSCKIFTFLLKHMGIIYQRHNALLLLLLLLLLAGGLSVARHYDDLIQLF